MSDTESINTFNSFASNLTTCEPLEKALSTFNGGTKFQRTVLEIVTALKNHNLSKGGSETSTEFYAATISFLKAPGIGTEMMEASLYILKHLMRQHISVGVLRYTTSDLSKILLNCLSGEFGKNELIVTTALFCLSKLLAAQSNEDWKLDNITHLYRTLFSFTTDPRKAIIKVARKSVLLIFTTKTKKNGLVSKNHPLNKETIAILTNSIKAQNATNKKRECLDATIKVSKEDDRLSFSLTTLSILLQSKLLNTECVVVYLETLIQCLLSLQVVPIQCQILNILAELFVRRVLMPEQIARSITSLFAYLNSICVGKNHATSAIPPNSIGSAWLKTVQLGFESLLLCGQSTFVDSTSGTVMDTRIVALTHATSIIKTAIDWILRDQEELGDSAFAMLCKLCSGALSTSEMNEEYLNQDNYPDTDNWLTKWGDLVCRPMLLGGQNTDLGTRSIDLLVHLTTKSEGKCSGFLDLLLRLLPQIGELRDSFEDTEQEAIAALVHGNKNNNKLGRPREGLSAGEKALKKATESLVGTAMKLYGPVAVARALPLTDVALLTSTRTWLVPLVKMYTEYTELDQFRQVVLPVIQQVTRQIDELSTDPNVLSPAVVTLGTLRYQLWSCLPSFAKCVTPGSIRAVNDIIIPFDDAGNTSGTLWQLLIELLGSPDGSVTNLEVIVMSTIRQLIKNESMDTEAQEVLTSSHLFPQFVQRLFSLYLAHGQRDRSLAANITTTLSVYLPLFDAGTFDANSAFLINNKLADIDRTAPSEQQLLCIDLLLMLAPHLTVPAIGTAVEFVTAFLNIDQGHSHGALQKRAYRLLQQISAANTDTSLEYMNTNRLAIVSQLVNWRDHVTTDSWKCRIKVVYNIFKLLIDEEDKNNLLNGFLPETIGCLNMPNKKTRAIAGMLLVEEVLGCGGKGDGNFDDEDLSTDISGSINNMLQRIITCIRDSIDDNSARAVQFKGALAKALYLVVSENRLAKSVSRQHIVDTMAVVSDILARPVGDGNRHLVYCALDILAGLTRKKTANFNNIHLADVGQCIAAASSELRMKVRMPIKRILKKMLKLWPYENIKKCIPADLIPVLRNINKSMNRSKRASKDEGNDNESHATSWGGVSDVASQYTMKNPHIKNIAELLQDTDSEDEDLKSRITATTLGNKSIKSTASRASELRKQRKRKIDSANATLHLEEQLDDIVDLSDPTSMVRHLRISDRKERNNVNFAEPAVEPTKTDKSVDRRGFHFEAGRLVIGKPEEIKEVENKTVDDDDSENENYKSEKGRFQPVKKRMRKDKLPGSEYKSKKGTFGDVKKKDRPDPYAYIQFKSTEQCHNVMKKYEKETKKAHKAARQMSKSRKIQKK